MGTGQLYDAAGSGTVSARGRRHPVADVQRRSALMGVMHPWAFCTRGRSEMSVSSASGLQLVGH